MGVSCLNEWVKPGSSTNPRSCPFCRSCVYKKDAITCLDPKIEEVVFHDLTEAQDWDSKISILNELVDRKADQLSQNEEITAQLHSSTWSIRDVVFQSIKLYLRKAISQAENEGRTTSTYKAALDTTTTASYDDQNLAESFCVEKLKTMVSESYMAHASPEHTLDNLNAAEEHIESLTIAWTQGTTMNLTVPESSGWLKYLRLSCLLCWLQYCGEEWTSDDAMEGLLQHDLQDPMIDGGKCEIKLTGSACLEQIR